MTDDVSDDLVRWARNWFLNATDEEIPYSDMRQMLGHCRERFIQSPGFIPVSRITEHLAETRVAIARIEAALAAPATNTEMVKPSALPFVVGQMVECIDASGLAYGNLEVSKCYKVSKVTISGYIVVREITGIAWVATRFRAVAEPAPEPETFTYAQACVLAKLGLRMKPVAWGSDDDWWLSSNGQKMQDDCGRTEGLCFGEDQDSWVMLPVQPL